MGRNPLVTIAGTLVMGVLGASIPIITQAVLADQHGSLRGVAFTESNAIASASGTLAPLCLGFFARTSLGWRAAMALAILAVLPLFLSFRHRSLSAMPRRTVGPARGSSTLPAPYWAYWLLLLLAVAIEFCIIYWVADFLEKARGLARPDAALSTSVFLTSMLLGRTLGSWVLRRNQSIRLLFGSVALATLGFLVHWQAPLLPLAHAGLFLAGLGVANLYPLGLTFAMGTVGGQTDKASARASLGVALAILCLPLLLGRLADLSDIATAYGLVAVLLGLALLVVPLARALDLAWGRLLLHH
jgi:fucose permease